MRERLLRRGRCKTISALRLNRAHSYGRSASSIRGAIQAMQFGQETQG
jgi:hypothetical protein